MERARERSPLVARTFDVAERDSERLGGLLAGALAYRLFLWLLPFCLLLVGLLGAITSLDDGAPNTLSDDLGLHGTLAELVRDGAQQQGWWLAIPVGLFGTLWAGVGAMKAVRISHAAAWGVRPPPPPNPLRATLGFATIALLLIATSVVATWLREAQGAVGLVATLLVVVLYFVAWMFVSVRLPRRPGPVRDLVPGAVLVAVGAQALHLFTVWYLTGRAERATSTYGAIGAALVILLWLYLLSRVVVGAAVLNAELSSRGGGREESS